MWSKSGLARQTCYARLGKGGTQTDDDAILVCLQACTSDGTVYDITNIVPYIQKFRKHPVSGEPLQLKDVIQLHFHKNADGEYHDPILHKVMNVTSAEIQDKRQKVAHAATIWNNVHASHSPLVHAANADSP